MPSRETTPALRRTAREAFGWPRLRPGQLEAMQSVMAGHDTLVVMPTGAGKSACYQVPALLLDGPTAVVSPLIALQRDQVLDLLGHGAFAANSAQRASAVDAGWEAVAAGDDYLRLGDVVDRLGHPVTLALAATAAPPVREEIVTRLRMREPVQLVRGFDRPNLHLEVVAARGAALKLDAVTAA